jgi:ABC-type transport system involved in multi-copper enzyme maturation permease subunit
MIWLIWRQHRAELMASGLVLALILLVLLVTGIHITDVSQSTNLLSCASKHLDCSSAQNTVSNYITNHAFGSATFYNIFQYFLLALPLLLGMFVGAHLVAREFEQGTYRLVWTQSISWSHWLCMKIALLACFVVCATGILYGVFIWWKTPALAAFNNPWLYSNYDIWGFVPIAYTLFALVLGIAAGTVVRKTVPAMAITLIVFVVLRVLIEIFLRPYLLPPLVMVRPISIMQPVPIPAQSLIISYSTEQYGKPVSAELGDVCSTRFSQGETTEVYSTKYSQCLANHGFQNKVVYQPLDRLLLFQGMESSIYIFLAVILLGITVLWTRRSIS